MRAVTHPVTQGDHSGYQTTYYGRDSVNPTGSMTHLDNKNGGWTEASFGGSGQLLNTTSQTVNGDGTYTISSQDMRRDGTVSSSEQAIYGMDNNALQSLQRESTSPDGQTIQSLAQFNANQELVSAHAASFQNGVPVSSMDFARDSNSNYVESQTNYDHNGAISSTAAASFDSSGALLGGQMNYAHGPLNEVAFARTPDGDFYARQSFRDGTQSDSIVSYNAVQSNLANVQANGFDASPDIDNSLTVHDNSVDNFHTVAGADSFNSNYVQPASYSAPSVQDVTNVSGYPTQDISTTSSTFDASSTHSVSAQDAYHNQAVHQQQHEHNIAAQHANANTQWTNVPAQTVDGGTSYSTYAKDAVMPPQEHPNADAIVQKTLASIEQLAVHWMATRMEALKAIEDKPLDSTPAKGLDGVSSMGVVNPPPMPNHIITNWNDGGYYAAQSNAGANASNVDKLSAEQAATIAGNPTEYSQSGMEIDSQTAQYSLPPIASGQPSWDDVRVSSNDPAVANGLQSTPEFSRDAIQTVDVASTPTVDNSLTVHDNSMDSYTSHHTSAPTVTPVVAPESSRVHTNLAQDSYASPAVEDSATILAYREQETRTNADGQQVNNQHQQLNVPDTTIETSSSALSKETVLPPQNANMPNADAIVQKTLDSLEHLAVQWLATRVQALDAIEDKGLNVTPGNIIGDAASMASQSPPPTPDQPFANLNTGFYPAANLSKLADTPVAPPPMLADAASTPELENATSPVLVGEFSTGTIGVAPESVLAKETVFQQNTGTTPAPAEGPTLKRIDQTYNTAGMTVENYHNAPTVNDPVANTPSANAQKGAETSAQSKVDRPASDKPDGEEKGSFIGKVLDVSNRPNTKPIVGPPPSHDKANIKKVLDRMQNASEKDEDSDKADEQLPSWMKW
jgi:hypothetical protein